MKPETTTAKRSARKTLPKSADWLSRAYEAATDAQKPAVAVLWASGCRPAEIAMGVDVSKRKGGVLVIEIPGAKVKDDAGQPRRSIAIKADSDAGKALLDVMGEKDRMTIIFSFAVLSSFLDDYARTANFWGTPPNPRSQKQRKIKRWMFFLYIIISPDKG